jgi:hypothetical protein
MQPTTTPPTHGPAALPRALVEESLPVIAPPPRSIAARGRTALLWGAVAFLVGQLALAVAIEWRLPELRDPTYGRKERRLLQRLGQSPAPPRTVVMLGSSRTMYGLRGRDVERALAGPDGAPLVFNFGLPGAGPLTELLALRRLLRRGVRPDLLLVEVLPPVLAGQVRVGDFAHMDPARLWHADLPLAERYLPQEPSRAGWWAGWPVPCHSHRLAIVSVLSPGLLPMPMRLDWLRDIDDSGWVDLPVFGAEPQRRRQATDKVHREYAYYLDGFRLGGPNPLALCELLDLCRQEGIPAVLVLMPEGSAFRGWYAPSAWAEVEGFLGEVGRDYGVDVIDAHSWLPDEDFADSHHLLPEGRHASANGWRGTSSHRAWKSAALRAAAKRVILPARSIGRWRRRGGPP